MDTLADNHPWVSCVYVQPQDPYTRPQRMMVLQCVLFGNITIAALFFELPSCTPEIPGYPDCPEQEEAAEEPDFIMPGFKLSTLITSVIIAMIMMPADRLFIGMFEKIRPDGPGKAASGPDGRPFALPTVRTWN